jgi:hypothetical protein
MTNHETTMETLFPVSERLDDADVEEAVAVLFEAALDPETGLLQPCLVKEWPDLLESEGVTMAEFVGDDMAWVLELFRVGYCQPRRKSFIAFGNPLKLKGSKEWPGPQINQTLRILARCIRLGRQGAVQKILGSISAGPDSLKRAIGPWAIVRPVRLFDIPNEEQARLGLEEGSQRCS